jgi:paraquat-inducible protein A
MPQDVVLCEQCDAVHRWRALAPHQVAHCSRCGAVLARGHRLDVGGLLALTVAAGVVLLIGICTPMMTLELRGAQSAATLPDTIAATWAQGQRLVAVAAALTSIVAPAALIVLRLVVLVPMARGERPDRLAWCMRALHEAARWNMVEVLAVGAVVTLVRLAAMAPSAPGPGLFAFAALPLLLAALQSAGLRHLWQERR